LHIICVSCSRPSLFYFRLFAEAEVAPHPLLPFLLLVGVLRGAGGGLLGQPHPTRGGGQVHHRHHTRRQACRPCSDSGTRPKPFFLICNNFFGSLSFVFSFSSCIFFSFHLRYFYFLIYELLWLAFSFFYYLCFNFYFLSIAFSFPFLLTLVGLCICYVYPYCMYKSFRLL
jgi:hypothetical protein